MSAVTRPRGPLPRRVYWTRRLGLLLVLAALVLGTGRLLGGQWPGGGGARATTVAARTTSDPSVAVGPTAGPATGLTASASPSGSPTDIGPSPSGTGAAGAGGSGGSGRRGASLPDPEGPCDDADVVVDPRVTAAHVGSPIQIVLAVSTAETPACTWQVGPDSVFVKVTAGSTAGSTADAAESTSSATVWSSQDCPATVPTAQVVARREVPAEVVVSWSGQMSDSSCSSATAWSRPGTYRVTAIARGAVTPLTARFRLHEAIPPTVIASPTDSASATGSDGPGSDGPGSDGLGSDAPGSDDR